MFAGLSNFNSKQVDEIISKGRIMPAVLQVECHPYLNQAALVEHCKKQDVVGKYMQTLILLLMTQTRVQRKHIFQDTLWAS